MIKAVTAPKGQDKSFYKMNDKDILDDKRQREKKRWQKRGWKLKEVRRDEQKTLKNLVDNI